MEKKETKSCGPLVTIITVCYNSERTIRRTLESVLHQTYQNYEYLIVDGSSTDGTLPVIQDYEPRFGGRLRLISEKDNGIYDAMNKGISLAKGELIGMINSDDWYERNAIELILRGYEPGSCQILYGMQREYEDGREKVCWLKHHDFLEQQMITHPTCFVSKQVYDRFGAFDLKYRSSADYDFMLRMYYSKEVIFCPIYEVIANFSLGGISGHNIGRIETANIRYHYGIISGRSRFCILLVNYAKMAVKRVMGRKRLR